MYGPGRHHEHKNPHIVAGWQPPEAIDPLQKDNGKLDLRRLADILEAPLALMDDARRPDKPVWHCSIRAAPGDRTLTDDEWRDIAGEVMHRTGLAPRDREDQAVPRPW